MSEIERLQEQLRRLSAVNAELLGALEKERDKAVCWDGLMALLSRRPAVEVRATWYSLSFRVAADLKFSLESFTNSMRGDGEQARAAIQKAEEA